MPHLRGDLTTWSMWRQHADSSSTKPRITCKKGGPSSSRGKLWKINKDNQWPPISSFRCLLFSIFIFVCIFIFACLTDLFLFFAGTFEYFHPWSWLQKFKLGGHRLVFCKLEKFSVPFLYFVSFYLFILFLIAYYCFLTLGTMSSLSVGV